MTYTVVVRTVQSMPRAQDYRNGAATIEHSMDSIAAMSRILDRRRDDFGFSGTSIAGTVQRGIVAGSANASRAAGVCEQLAAELHRRAALCDQYTVDVAAYRNRLSDWTHAYADWEASTSRGGSAHYPGARPQRPPRPFEGAQSG